MAGLLEEQGLSESWPASMPSQREADQLSYEEQLNRDPRWALSEGSRYFEEKSAVQEALRKIARRLDELGIPYAVVGGMALFAHGFRRFTEDVDILVTREALKVIHKELDGLGYVTPFPGSKNLRDAQLKVRIEFLIAGHYPGDGKPKPVSFPDPARSAFERDGIRYLELPVLIELKLASGMTSLERMKDLADVQELIKLLALPEGFSERLHPFVQEKYAELWRGVMGTRKRYMMLWSSELLTPEARTLDDMIAALPGAASTLEAMRADGVTLERRGGAAGGHVYLVTTDPEIARKYGMHAEEEFAVDDTGAGGEEEGQR